MCNTFPVIGVIHARAYALLGEVLLQVLQVLQDVNHATDLRPRSPRASIPFATQEIPRQRTGVTPTSICLKERSDEAFTSRPRPIF